MARMRGDKVEGTPTLARLKGNAPAASGTESCFDFSVQVSRRANVESCRQFTLAAGSAMMPHL